MLRVAGEKWTDQNGSEFRAIFDENQQLVDSVGAVKLVTVLTCLSSIAKHFDRKTTELTNSNDRTYRVREVLVIDDGALSQVQIVPTSTEECCE